VVRSIPKTAPNKIATTKRQVTVTKERIIISLYYIKTKNPARAEFFVCFDQLKLLSGSSGGGSGNVSRDASTIINSGRLGSGGSSLVIDRSDSTLVRVPNNTGNDQNDNDRNNNVILHIFHL
jgi:hypothetical protein